MSNQSLHILFLSSWYPSRVHPTLGNFVQRHAQAVAQLHKVTVLYCVAEHDRNDIEITDNRIDNLREIVVYGPKSQNPLHSKKMFERGVAYIHKELSDPFQLIHQHVIWKSGWQARILSKRWSIPYVITEHWTGYSHKRKSSHSPLLRALSKWVVSKASFICPVSDDLGKTMREFGLHGRYAVVPNVVNTTLFQIGPKQSGQIRYLHVSSLDDTHKNISGILTAWKVFSEHNNQVHLNIGGDGPYEKYQMKAREMGIREESISFFGTQTEQEIAARMSTSHVLILFSNYENLPVVIVEALSCGVFIISSDVGGIKEHMTEERGMLIEPGDTYGLIEALNLSTAKVNSLNKEELRAYAVKHFSVTEVAKNFDSVYRLAIAEHQKKNVVSEGF